jgi:sigma-B regulation protein RsbU (phosphoserine phosphatase)
MSTAEPLNPTLELVRDGRVERVFEIRGTDLHLGRLPGLDVQFDDTRVSRHHARVERRPDGSCYVVDLESKSSTLLNGRRLTPFQPALLRDGFRIRIVEHELVFRDQSVKLLDGPDGGPTVIDAHGDLTTVGLARRSPAPAAAFQAVLDVNRALGGGAELNVVISRALDGLMAVFPRAERGFVLTAEPDGTYPLLAVRHRLGPGRPPELSRTILDLVINQGKAVLISDALIDPRFMDHKSVASALRTALCVPLPGHDGHALGMVQIDSLALTHGFMAADLDLLAALALPIGVAVENHRLLTTQASWAAAGEIQLALLPRGRPDLPGYAFWECYRPALEVGGDLYDYIPVEPSSSPATATEPTRWAVAVGDVSGKGMPAALMMAGTSPEVRQLVRAGVAPDEVMRRVNHRVSERGLDNRFITLVLVEIDPLTHCMNVASAGHLPPLIRRADGSIEFVTDTLTGYPLGIELDAEYGSAVVELQPGDVVILLSDGVIDAQDRLSERFGDERLRRAITDAPQGAAATGEAILAAVCNHAAGRSQFDDITLVCFGRDR